MDNIAIIKDLEIAYKKQNIDEDMTMLLSRYSYMELISNVEIKNARIDDEKRLIMGFPYVVIETMNTPMICLASTDMLISMFAGTLKRAASVELEATVKALRGVR